MGYMGYMGYIPAVVNWRCIKERVVKSANPTQALKSACFSCTTANSSFGVPNTLSRIAFCIAFCASA